MLDKLFKENLIRNFKDEMRNVVDDREPGAIVRHTLEELEKKAHGGYDIAGPLFVRSYEQGFAPLFKRFNPTVSAVLEIIKHADTHSYEGAYSLVTDKIIERNPVESLEALLKISEIRSNDQSSLEKENAIFLRSVKDLPDSNIAAITKDFRGEKHDVRDRLAFLFEFVDGRENALELLATALNDGIIYGKTSSGDPRDGYDYSYLSEDKIFQVSNLKLELPEKVDSLEKILEATLYLYKEITYGKGYELKDVLSSPEKLQLLNDIATSPYLDENPTAKKAFGEVINRILETRTGELEIKMEILNESSLSNLYEKVIDQRGLTLVDLAKENPQYAEIFAYSGALKDAFKKTCIKMALNGELEFKLTGSEYSWKKYEILGVTFSEREFADVGERIENLDEKIVFDFCEKPKTGSYLEFFKDYLTKRDGDIFGKVETRNIATTEELQYIALALGYVPEAEPATDKLGIIFKAINQLERNDNGDLIPALKVANPTLRQSYIELTGDSSNKLEENFDKYEKIVDEIAKGITNIGRVGLAYYLAYEAPNSVVADRLTKSVIDIQDRHDKENETTESLDTSERQDDKNDNLESDKDNNNDDAE